MKSTATNRLETFHKYRIIEKLGSGGMGVVYRARDPLLKREVALKIFRPNLFEDPSYLIRFRQEAEIAARLHHPNIAPLYEFGIYDQCPYYTMELIRGESLSAVIQRMGRLPTRAALLVVRDCALALHYAHTQGVIHRDIKSSNILLRPRPSGQGSLESARDSTIDLASGVVSDFQAVLLDFGLARLNTADQAVTQAGDLVGTPSYMSPEQVSGRLGVVTAKSDIFSLGVVLYEALTGQLPFFGEELHVMLSRIESEDPVPPRKLVPTLHRDVDAIVLKALEKNPDRRYETSEAFAADIDRYLRGEVTEARPASPMARLWRKVRKHRHLLLPPAVSLILTLIVFGYLTVYVPLQRKAEAREVEIRLLERALEQKRSLEELGRMGRIEAEKRIDQGDLEGTISLCQELEAKLGRWFSERPEVPKVEHVDWENDPRFQELKDGYRLPIPHLHLLRAEALAALDRPREALMAHSLAYATSRLTGDAAGLRALLAIGKILEAMGREREALRAYRLHWRNYPGTLQSDEAAFLAGMLSLKLGEPDAALAWLERARNKGRLPASQNSAAERTISLLKEWVPEHVATIHGRWLGAGDADGDGTDELLALDVLGRLRILHMEDEGWISGHEQQLLPVGVARAMDEEGQPVRLAVANLDGVGRPELIVATRHKSIKTTGISVFTWHGKEYQPTAQRRLGPNDEVLGFVPMRWGGDTDLHLAIPSRAMTGGLRLLKLTAHGLVEDSFVNLHSPPSLVAAADIDAKPGDELIVAVAGESPGVVLLRQSARSLQISDRFKRLCRASGLSVAHTDLILTCEEMGRGQEALEGGLWWIRLDGAAFGEPVRLLPLDRTGPQTLLLGAHGMRGRREIILAEIGVRNELSYRVLSFAAWGETDTQFRTGSRDSPPAGWIPFFRSSRHVPSEPRASTRPMLVLPSLSPTGWRLSTLGSGIRSRRPFANPDPDIPGKQDLPDPSSRKLKVIDEFISLGLPEVALELCERTAKENSSPEALAAIAMKRGRCLQDMERSAESWAAYQEAAERSPLLAVDALTAIAASRADQGDWEGVRQSLQSILNQHAPGGLRGARIESEVQEASDILSQQPRLLVGRDLREGLLSESPHHITFMAEGSKIGVRGTKCFHAYRHAFPFRYDGSTMSASASLKVIRADPGTRLALEIGSLATYPIGDPREPGYIRVGFEATFGPIPTLRTYAIFSDGDIAVVERDLPPDLPTRVNSIQIQILGVSRAVIASINDLRIRVPLPRDLPRGNYAIVIGAGGREEGGEGMLQVEFDQFTLNSAGRELRPTRSEASTPEERILAAGGQIAAGNIAGCLRQLELLSAGLAPPTSSAAHELLSYLRVPLSPRQIALLYKGLVGPSPDSENAKDDLQTVFSEEPVRGLGWLHERVDGMDDVQRSAARRAIARHASADWVRKLGASLEATRGFEPALASTIRRELEDHLWQTSVQHALLWAIHYVLDPGGTFADFVGQGMDLRFRRACRVSEVRPDSQAAAAGLLPGDVLLSCDGQPVESESDFTRALTEASRPTATVLLLRRGRSFAVEMRREASGLILTQTWAAVSNQ